jgi:hypothetical protein
MSNKRDRISGERWRVTEPGWNEREPERPLLIAKVVELAFGPDAELEAISSGVCHWKSEYLQQLLATQATPKYVQVPQVSTKDTTIAPVISLRRGLSSESWPEGDDSASAVSNE